MEFPKPKKIKDKNHLKEVREKGCLVCGQKADAHHLNAGGFGSDYSTIPLCRMHHSECHMDQEKFEKKYRLNCWNEAWKIITELTGLE